MLAMKTCSLFPMLFLFPLAKSLILPIIISKTCHKQRSFKSIQCDYNGVELSIVVTFGPTDDPNQEHKVKLLIDTGIWHTWLITSNTVLLNDEGEWLRWADIATVPVLAYAPDSRNGLDTSENASYIDDWQTLRAFKNHRLEFDHLIGEKIRVPMDLYFAEKYILDSASLPVNSHGTLGLSLSKQTKDVNNLFLYKFREAYPDLYHQPMMSFDINWNEGVGQPSCFGLGEALPAKNNFPQTSVTLQTVSDVWSILLNYMQLDFPNRRILMIQPDTEYLDLVPGVYLNTVGIVQMVATPVSGTKSIDLPNNFYQQMNLNERQIFDDGYQFNCSDYEQVLPKITFVFGDEIREVRVTVSPNKLYRTSENPEKCLPLLGTYDSAKYEGTDHIMVYLGVPFFASVYMEMKWSDTRNMPIPIDLGHIATTVTLANK